MARPLKPNRILSEGTDRKALEPVSWVKSFGDYLFSYAFLKVGSRETAEDLVQETFVFSYSWQGTEWHFKNQANLDAFKANPEKYAPQFGGYCAYGAMENHKAPTEPSAFTIIDNKLYLNYNQKVRELWKKDTKGNIEHAEINWVTLKDKE